MDIRPQLIAIGVCALLLLTIFELVRRRRLLERYAILWLCCGAILMVLAVWRHLLEVLANAAGVAYAPSALFIVALGCILLLLLHFSLVISRLVDQNKVLAQSVGLLTQRIEQLEASDDRERDRVLSHR
jgi:hypothetical protein